MLRNSFEFRIDFKIQIHARAQSYSLMPFYQSLEMACCSTFLFVVFVLLDSTEFFKSRWKTLLRPQEDFSKLLTTMLLCAVIEVIKLYFMVKGNENVAIQKI